MFARFDENPAMTLQDIKKTKRYGRTDARTEARTDTVKTVNPPQTKFAGGGGGIINRHHGRQRQTHRRDPQKKHRLGTVKKVKILDKHSFQSLIFATLC